MNRMITDKELISLGGSYLDAYVRNYLLDIEPENRESFIMDVLSGGGQSGVITSLIYTTDCLNFFELYATDINDLLYETMYGTGLNLTDLFNGWDYKDPLCLECTNQTILAWFGFEETCRNLGYALELEV